MTSDEYAALDSQDRRRTSPHPRARACRRLHDAGIPWIRCVLKDDRVHLELPSGAAPLQDRATLLLRDLGTVVCSVAPSEAENAAFAQQMREDDELIRRLKGS
jgi:hypothetical protein